MDNMELINFFLVLILFIAMLMQYAKLQKAKRHFDDLDYLYTHDTKKQLVQIDKLNNSVDMLIRYSDIKFGKKN